MATRDRSVDKDAPKVSDLQSIISDLNDKGVSVSFISEGLKFGSDSNDAFAKLQLQMMGAFAEFERNIIWKRQAVGIAKAKERGVYKGRAEKINNNKIVELRNNGYGATEIASEMGITRTSVYYALKVASQSGGSRPYSIMLLNRNVFQTLINNFQPFRYSYLSTHMASAEHFCFMFKNGFVSFSIHKKMRRPKAPQY